MKFDGPVAEREVEARNGPNGQLRNGDWPTLETEGPGRRRPWRPQRPLPSRLQLPTYHDLKKG